MSKIGSMNLNVYLFCILILSILSACSRNWENASDIEFITIEKGTFRMGSEQGDWDEKPQFDVTITDSFRLAVHEVTNEQYERYDPKHRELRGKEKTSLHDSDPVVFVSWDDAMGFCRWLSEKKGKSYRLPSEAEWEFACQQQPHLFSTKVENWCYDWYGPYTSNAKTDPLGYTDGDLRVTRGGSYRSEQKTLFASNRSANVPEDRNRVVSFRTVQGDLPAGTLLQERPVRQWARDVSQKAYNWKPRVDMNKPYFAQPIPYVNIPEGMNGPLYHQHNHCPGITYCDNGDLFAIWYTTIREVGRELAIAGARLRRGNNTWDKADLFWDVPDRNDHAPTVWTDGQGTLYHFNGFAVEGTWQELALFVRTSTNTGVSWSKPRIINAQHGYRNMPISSTFKTRDGVMVLPCDAVPGGKGGSAVHVSRDDGKTWKDLGRGKPNPIFAAGQSGAWIAGIHAAVDEWLDGSWVSVGRGDLIDGKLGMSISKDQGETWDYLSTPFPGISGGQRAAMRRLKEDCLMLISFTPGSDFQDNKGKTFEGKGLFAALSFDGGKTWPKRRLLTDGKELIFDGKAHTGKFTMTANNAEPKGYMTAVQTPDGIIHLISSGIHYRFNFAWLNEN